MRNLLTFLFIMVSVSIAPAQWIAQQSNLPSDVTVFSISAVNQDVAWASGMKYHGSFGPCNSFSRTVDGGKNWIAGTIPIPDNFIICNISAISADIAWAAVGGFPLSNQAGIYKTTDGGKTWTQQKTAFPYPNSGPNFVYFFDANKGLTVGDPVDNYAAIYTTADGGTIWERVPNSNNVPLFPGEGASINMYSATGTTFYFGGAYGSSGRIFRSTDKGKSWTVYNTGFTSPPANIHIWPAFKDSLNGLVFATGIARTSDGGQTWTRVSSPPIGVGSGASIPGTTGGYMTTRGAFGEKNPGSAYTLDNGITWTVTDNIVHGLPEFVSQDIGWSGSSSNVIYKWTISSGRKITAFPNPISFGAYEVGQTSDLNTIYVTNYSADTLTISNVLAPGPNFILTNPPTFPVKLATLHTLFLSISFAPQAAGSLQDSVVVISDASNAPSLAVPLMGTGLNITNTQPGTMYAASSSLHTINSSTGTATALASLGAVQIHSLAIRPSTMELYGVCGSTNPAILYHIDCITGDLLSKCTIPKFNLRAIAFSPSDTLYAANTSGELYRIDLKTGEARLIGASSGFMYAGLAFHPLTGQLWASFTTKGDKIYTVDTQTGTITLVGATGDNTPTPSLAFSFAGMLYGLKGAGTQPNKLISIDTNTGTGTVLGSTGVTGLRTIAMSPGTTAVEGRAPEGLPQSYALAQNYPNPFNAQTVIEYQLSKPDHVKLVVYNLLGQEIKTLINKNHAAGRFNLVWDGKDNLGQAIPSGVYFYRIQAEGFTETKKMLLLE